MKNFIIIDGNALIHRAFHALPPLKTKGQLVNAVYGFISILFRVIKELNPSYLAATFDLPGPTFRDVEYKEYKAKRVKGPQELYDQIDLVKKVVKALDIPIYEKKGFEADDVIGTIACLAKGVKTIIVTGDLDTLQLVDEDTEIYTMRRGIKDTVIYNEKAIDDRYGLKPDQIIDFKGLKGDPSDNIPGVPGVGEKTALDLIKKFNSLENLYNSLDELNPKLQARMLEYKKQAFFSQKLVTIKCDVPIKFSLKDCQWKGGTKEAVKVLEELEFHTLVNRLAEI